MGIVYKNGVPFVTFSFWFGDKMKGDRIQAFEQLKANAGTPFVLITEDNITDFELNEHPFHPAARYTLQHRKGLSGNHMTDYFRNYFSYHYGGAYHDIKLRSKTQSIAECWKVFKDYNVWLVGMEEIQGGVDSYNIDVADYIKQHEIYQPDVRRTKAGH